MNNCRRSCIPIGTVLLITFLLAGCCSIEKITPPSEEQRRPTYPAPSETYLKIPLQISSQALDNIKRELTNKLPTSLPPPRHNINPRAHFNAHVTITPDAEKGGILIHYRYKPPPYECLWGEIYRHYERKVWVTPYFIDSPFFRPLSLSYRWEQKKIHADTGMEGGGPGCSAERWNSRDIYGQLYNLFADLLDGTFTHPGIGRVKIQEAISDATGTLFREIWTEGQTGIPITTPNASPNYTFYVNPKGMHITNFYVADGKFKQDIWLRVSPFLTEEDDNQENNPPEEFPVKQDPKPDYPDGLAFFRTVLEPSYELINQYIAEALKIPVDIGEHLKLRKVSLKSIEYENFIQPYLVVTANLGIQKMFAPESVDITLYGDIKYNEADKIVNVGDLTLEVDSEKFLSCIGLQALGGILRAEIANHSTYDLKPSIARIRERMTKEHTLGNIKVRVEKLSFRPNDIIVKSEGLKIPLTVNFSYTINPINIE